MLFLITYDLNRPGQNYHQLIAALTQMGAKRVLLSTWVLRRSGVSAGQIRDALRGHLIDQNDRLLVTVMGDWASWLAMVDINQVA